MADPMQALAALAQCSVTFEKNPDRELLRVAYHFAMDQLPVRRPYFSLEEVTTLLPLAARSLRPRFGIPISEGFTANEKDYFEIVDEVDDPLPIYATLLVYHQLVHGQTPLEEAANDTNGPRRSHVYFDDPRGWNRIIVFYDGVILVLGQYDVRHVFADEEFDEMHQVELRKIEARLGVQPASTWNNPTSKLLGEKPILELVRKK